MSVRKYEFTVSADSEGVLRRVWGGIQFEDNATEFCFKPDASLLLAAGDGALCRIDINSASGWDPSETLSPNSSGYYCRAVPYSATRFGGEIEIVFVISNENCEILSYPVRAYFTEMSRSPRSEEKVYENISGMEQEVKLHAEGVSAELKRCEELRGEVSYYHTAVGGMKEDILAAGVSADELKATKNEAEALITEVETKLEAGEFKGEKGEAAVTDQTYNPESPNAQSGIAVAEALSNIGGGSGTWEKIVDITTTEEVGSFIATAEEFPELAKSKEYLLRVVLPKVSENLSLGTMNFNFKTLGITYEQPLYINTVAASSASVNELRLHAFFIDDIAHAIGGYGGQGSIKTAASVSIGDRTIKGDFENFACKLSGSNMFPIGTKFIIYGKVEG